MFEKATRLRLRFGTSRGAICTEELWRLPLTSNTGKVNLDDIAKALSRELREADDDSFVTPVASNVELTLRFDIVKHIIGVKIAERDAAKDIIAKKAQKEKILEAMEAKNIESLGNKSMEELQKELDSL